MSRRFDFVKKGFTKFFALFGECLPEQVYFSLVCSPKNSCLIAWYYDNPRDCKAIRIKIINRGNIRCNTGSFYSYLVKNRPVLSVRTGSIFLRQVLSYLFAIKDPTEPISLWKSGCLVLM